MVCAAPASKREVAVYAETGCFRTRPRFFDNLDLRIPRQVPLSLQGQASSIHSTETRASDPCRASVRDLRGWLEGFSSQVERTGVFFLRDSK